MLRLMKLYVIRHAEAAASNGSEITLTEKGERQAVELGDYFRKRGLRPDIVLTSPVLRAKQTAEILCDVARIEVPCVEAWLACGMAPEVAHAELLSYAGLESVVIVGHQPDLGAFLADALGEFDYAVKKASLTLIDYRSRNSILLERR